LTLTTSINWPAIAADLDGTLFSDRVKLGKRIGRAQAQNDLADIENLVKQISLSKSKVRHRQERLPQPSFSDALPIANKRAEIQAAIAANQVVIVCGETGSGKTTQLPKICLELKRGIYGTIGCTQPRHNAARIAQELQTDLGQVVGYKVRFTERVHDDILVKAMRPYFAGRNSQRPLVSQYDTLIIDEAPAPTCALS
jgi:ATP-dependent helicase HrpA